MKPPGKLVKTTKPHLYRPEALFAALHGDGGRMRTEKVEDAVVKEADADGPDGASERLDGRLWRHEGALRTDFAFYEAIVRFI